MSIRKKLLEFKIYLKNINVVYCYYNQFSLLHEVCWSDDMALMEGRAIFLHLSHRHCCSTSTLAHAFMNLLNHSSHLMFDLLPRLYHITTFVPYSFHTLKYYYRYKILFKPDFIFMFLYILLPY